MQVNEKIEEEEKLQDIIGMTCIYVPVNDVYESVKWYQKNLGCEPSNIHEVKPGMEIAILRFLDSKGNPQDAATGSIPALFLLGGGGGAEQAAGSYGFTFDNGHRQAVACFVTPRIQELFERFKKNGVNIVDGIRQTCGPNLQFYDPDGNMWEIWQP